jgi:hypothetical protein
MGAGAAVTGTPLVQWSSSQVASAVASLGDKFDEIAPQFLTNDVDGLYLQSIKSEKEIALASALVGITDDQRVKTLVEELNKVQSAEERLQGSPPFPKSGVSLQLLQRLREIAREKEWTTTDLSDKLVKPMTESRQCSFEELMKQEHMDDPHGVFGLTYDECFPGPATVFVPHAWRYQFDELVTAIETFTTEQGGEWSYWLDLFVNDQWNAPNLPYEWWSNTFSSAIGQIGHTMLVLSPWDAPIPLTRAWCLWEILCTIKQQARLTVQLSTHQRDTFVEKLRTDYDYIMRALCKIDTQKSEAWNASDREMIFAAVALEEGGFSAVNNLITAQIRDWLAVTARALASAKGDSLHVLTMTELDDLTRAADLLSDQGKMEEARGYYEKAAAGYHSALGADDPRTLNTINNLAVLYCDLGCLPLARDMFERSLASKEKTLGMLRYEV